MDARNKTQKRAAGNEEENVVIQGGEAALDPFHDTKLHGRYAAPPLKGEAALDPFRNLLDESARDAFRRPWHRLERGLRLNRLRMYVEEMSAQCSFTTEEKSKFFVFLQNALDRKLLNTHKIVEYLPELQKIKSIKGLEVRRAQTGEAKWGFTRAKKPDGTRRKKSAQTDNKVEGGEPENGVL
jgi:hypothetical protein